MTAGLGTVTAVPGQEIPTVTGFPVEARLSSAFNILIHVDITSNRFRLDYEPRIW